MSTESDNLYKIVLTGDAGVGKTNLLQRYIKGQLPKAQSPTIGVQFATRTVPLPTGGTIKTQIWDTAGQERYRAITTAHYKRAIGALLVYDIWNEKSFKHCKDWLHDLRKHAEPQVTIMLVGNKLDLLEHNPSLRVVQYDRARLFAMKNDLLFWEASAEATTNVKEAFEQLLVQIFKEKSKLKRGIAALDPSSRLQTFYMPPRSTS